MIDIKKEITPHKPYRLVFFGDSITSSEWVFPSWPMIIQYVLYMEKRLGWEPTYINTGCNASNSRQHLEIVKSHVLDFNPDIAFYTLSKNDMFVKNTPEEYEKNSLDIVNTISTQVKNTVVLSPPAMLRDDLNSKYEQYSNDLLETLKKNNDIYFVNLFEHFQAEAPRKDIYTYDMEYDVPETGLKKGELDYIHPNRLGAAYIAKYVLRDVFGIDIDSGLLIKDIQSGRKSPNY